jgi:AcrR family transcriptional regulator
MSRTYASPLRRAQRDATRVRIVEAVARVLARGLTELSVPAVAEEADVSVATVYRHFQTKQELVAGLRQHYKDQLDAQPSDWSDGRFASIEEVLEELTKAAARLARIEPTLWAAVASGEVDEFRREHRAERLEPIETALRRERPDIVPADLQKLRDLIAVLCSSPGVRAFEILTGASPEEAGETIAWAIRRLLGSFA